MKIPLWIIKRLQEFYEISVMDSSKPRQREARMNIEVRAFDTETLHGYCKLLACDNGDYVFFDKFTSDNLTSLLKFLCRRKYSRTLNFFYNIDYDVAAIAKYLPRKNLIQLMSFNHTNYQGYDISYVPYKCFTIRHNKIVCKYFDLWQYYRMSLDAAARKYLQGEHKDPIDREKLGTQESYWKQNLHEIIQYCIKDCQLTAELARILQQKLNSIGISFDNPYSTGSLSVRYISNYYEFPKFVPTEWNKYAYLTYYGGRFEVIRKGYFDHIIIQDINSAYPYQLTELIDISRGKWVKVDDLDEDADLGFYRIVIHSTDDSLVQPFSFRSSNGLVYYPEFHDILHFTTQDELLFALDNYDIDISVVDGWCFYADEYYYPFATIERIYNERKKVKKTDPVLQLVLKIIMNSLYGKMAEKTRVLVESDFILATEYVEIDGEIVPARRYYRAGKIFNPVYASLITARTRLMLLEKAHKNEDKVVAMFTDSILSTKRIVESSDVLGEWSDEGEGEALIVGCGVYTIRNENYVKTRLRGIHLQNSLDLIELAETQPNARKVTLSWKKAIKPKETIQFCNKYNIDMINHMIHYAKHIDVRMDTKRKWLNNPATFGELRRDSYESMPLIVR